MTQPTPTVNRGTRVVAGARPGSSAPGPAPGGDPRRSARAGQMVLLGVIVALVMLVVVLAVALGRDDAEAPPATPPPGAGSPSIDPGRRLGPIGVGWPRTEAGARAAAVDWSTTVFTAPLRAEWSPGQVAEVAATGYGPDLVATLSELRRSRFEQWGVSPDDAFEGWWTPLGTRTEGVDGNQATVAVWGIETASSAPATDADAVWVTITFDLRWERGDWRIAGVDSRSGPRPENAEAFTSLPEAVPR